MPTSIVCLDLEGVLIPEIWHRVAHVTAIKRLTLTTRDINNYSELMQLRISLLREHNIRLKDIQQIIETIDPLPGATQFLQSVRSRYQLIILSDTFEEFFHILAPKLQWPTIFCNTLEIQDNAVIGFNLRQPDGKRCAIEALHTLNYTTFASGDSYNDISMLQTATHGALFRPPAAIAEQYRNHFPCVADYNQLLALIDEALLNS